MESTLPESYVLPTLYGLDSKNKERYWKVWVIGNTVYGSHGLINGKSTDTDPRSYKALKVGGVSAEEHAKREAERSWIDQLEKNYHPKNKDGLKLEKEILKQKKNQGNTKINLWKIFREESQTDDEKENPSEKEAREDGIIDGFETNIKPMHCQKWSDTKTIKTHLSLEDEGAYIQFKLDGVRIIAHYVDGDIVFTTRQGKQIPWFKTLRKELSSLLRDYPNILPDGEFYAENLYGKISYTGKKLVCKESNKLIPKDSRFSVITSAVRPGRKEAHILEDQIMFHIFDIYDKENPEATQQERFKILKNMDVSEYPHITKVPRKVVNSVEEIEEYLDSAIEQGYEGVVMRSKKMIYEPNKKSLKMRKYKLDQDEEYVIHGVKLDEGVKKEHFRWECHVEDEEGTITKFYVKMKTNESLREEMIDNYENYIGKLLTVKFQEKSNKGVPRFPRGIAIRDYE
jgi:ATP-dependent DNA ligase